MSILDELKESAASDIPAYMDFLYRYDPKKQQIFVFYEGDEDAAFYQQFIHKAIDDKKELEEIIAGCKSNVLKLHHDFPWERYCKEQIVFIVDRDLSYWLEESSSYDSNVFVTDGYSFENYLVNEDIFIIWLIRFMGFARASKSEIEGMRNVFKSIIPCFRAAMMPIMAKAVIAKKHDKSVDLSSYKPMNDIHLDINNQELSIELYDSSRADILWRLKEGDQQEVNEQIVLFQNDSSNYWVRGKWDLLFLATLGDFMRQHASLFAPSLNREKLSPTCSVPLSQTATALASYWSYPTPHSFEIFLDQTLRIYCSKVSM